jgi:hypothetical protein
LMWPYHCSLFFCMMSMYYSFLKFCIYRFSLWYEFFVYYVLRVEKI